MEKIFSAAKWDAMRARMGIAGGRRVEIEIEICEKGQSLSLLAVGRRWHFSDVEKNLKREKNRKYQQKSILECKNESLCLPCGLFWLDEKIWTHLSTHTHADTKKMSEINRDFWEKKETSKREKMKNVNKNQFESAKISNLRWSVLRDETIWTRAHTDTHKD